MWLHSGSRSCAAGREPSAHRHDHSCSLTLTYNHRPPFPASSEDLRCAELQSLGSVGFFLPKLLPFVMVNLVCICCGCRAKHHGSIETDTSIWPLCFRDAYYWHQKRCRHSASFASNIFRTVICLSSSVVEFALHLSCGGHDWVHSQMMKSDDGILMLAETRQVDCLHALFLKSWTVFLFGSFTLTLRYFYLKFKKSKDKRSDVILLEKG